MGSGIDAKGESAEGGLQAIREMFTPYDKTLAGNRLLSRTSRV